MNGLLVIALIGGYLWFIFWSIQRIRPSWAKPLLVFVLALVPSADAIVGRYQLRQMCAKEGGMHIYRTVPNVKGLYQPGVPQEDWVTKYGFEFVEGERITDGKTAFVRLIKTDSGSLKELFDVTLMSEYAVRTKVQPDIQRNYELFRYATWIRTDIFVENRKTHEILGDVTDFNYAGGLIERFLASIYASRGNAGSCEISSNAWEYSQLNKILASKIFLTNSTGGHK